MASNSPMTTAEKFGETIRLVTKELKADSLAIQKKTGLQVLTGVVLKTPVDYGVARGNWQVDLISPRDQSVFLAKNDADGGAAGRKAIQDGVSKIIGATIPYQTHWIFNNVTYILVLDQGGFIPTDPGPSKDKRKHRHGRILVQGGYSTQAPAGMVDLTLEEVRQQFVGIGGVV